MLIEYARPIAEEIMEYIKPGCTQCEIAGSIRRGKPDVKDIEIVAAPDLDTFVWGYRSMMDRLLDELERQQKIIKAKGQNKYRKYAVYHTNPVTGWNETIALDLFMVTPPAQWGVIYTIRTGPGSKENNFSRWIVTQRSKGGALPDEASVVDGGVYVDGKIVPMPEEMDFLNYLGLGWIEPAERVAKWRRYA